MRGPEHLLPASCVCDAARRLRPRRDKCLHDVAGLQGFERSERVRQRRDDARFVIDGQLVGRGHCDGAVEFVCLGVGPAYGGAGLPSHRDQKARRKTGRVPASGSALTSSRSGVSTLSAAGASRVNRPHHQGPSLNCAMTTGASCGSPPLPETLSYAQLTSRAVPTAAHQRSATDPQVSHWSAFGTEQPPHSSQWHSMNVRVSRCSTKAVNERGSAAPSSEVMPPAPRWRGVREHRRCR